MIDWLIDQFIVFNDAGKIFSLDGLTEKIGELKLNLWSENKASLANVLI